jgi:xylulokinase
MLYHYRKLDDGLLQALANPLAAGMTGPSLLWLRDHEPAEYRSARWALQPKDWLRLQLTGEALSEPSDASATLLYDLEADDWSGRRSRLWGCGRNSFPRSSLRRRPRERWAGRRPGLWGFPRV